MSLIVVSLITYYVYVFGSTNELTRSSRKLKFTTLAAVTIISISIFELDIDINNLANTASYNELFKIFLILLSSVVWFDSIYTNYELYVNHHTDMYIKHECEYCQYCYAKWFKLNDLIDPSKMKLDELKIIMKKYKQLTLKKKMEINSMLLVGLLLWYYITKIIIDESTLNWLNDYFVKLLVFIGLSNDDSILLLNNYYKKIGYLVVGVLMFRYLARIIVNMAIVFKRDTNKLKTEYSSQPIVNIVSAIATYEALNIVRIILILMSIMIFPILIVLAGVKIHELNMFFITFMMLSIVEVAIFFLLIIKAKLKEYKKL